MTRKRIRSALAVLALACTTLPLAPAADAGILKDGDVVAIVGDSITEGKNYSSLIEDYLLQCQPAKVRVMQFGWGGEQASGLVARVDDVLAMKPSVVTLCYGMNDGHYTAITDEIRRVYHTNLLKAVQTFKAAGVRVIVGSPGCVDTTAFKRPTPTAEVYNVNLAALRDEAAAVAKETDSTFADVFDPMVAAMEDGKKRFGPAYSIAGGDGVHPSYNGGLAMAYAYLKALNPGGDLGTVHIDLTKHTATADGPHKVSGVDGNAVTLESAISPFCVWGDPKEQASTSGVIDAIPFDADLNRLTLIAHGPAAKYRVTWGKASRTFTADELRTGVNLAATLRDNPFVASFMAVHQAVMRKQNNETLLLKQLLHDLTGLRKSQVMADHATEIDGLASAIPDTVQRQSADVAALVKPVRHTITLEPLQ